MKNCCNISNPLIRDGVSQRQRQALALSPDYANLDERDLADFLVFAYHLAKQIQYYNLNNQSEGDWRFFFLNSTPIWIALISKTRWQVLNQLYQQQLNAFLQDQSSQGLQSILLTGAKLLSQIRLWYQSLQSYTPLKSIIRGLVNTNLGEAFARLYSFDLAYEVENGQRAVLNNFYSSFVGDFGLDSSRDFNPETESFYRDFANTFGLNLGTVVADDTPLNGTRYQARSQLNEVFQVIFQNYRQIIQLAPQYLLTSLEARQDHQPHLALYISFVEILKQFQVDLNRITQQHLDFFYQQVLQLPKGPAHPDQVHLLFELAKFQQEYLLQANSRFQAGKDATGKELFYQLNQDVVLNKTQVVRLKGLFLNFKTRQDNSPYPTTITGFYASPIANSADGNGEPFPKDKTVQAWLPFGSSSRNRVRIGIAIASPILLLLEGERIITFKFSLSGLKPNTKAPVNKLPELFKVSFSGEKDWIEAEILPGANQTKWEGNNLIVKVKVPANADPIVPDHRNLPDALLSTNQPVVRFELQDKPTPNQSEAAFTSAYDYFQGSKLTQIVITTEVNEVRNLILQNDLSVLNATKPFQPFGPQPKAGNNFYIGSQEIFQKPLTKLELNITFGTNAPPNWSQYYAAYANTIPTNLGNLNIQALRGKVWQPLNSPPQKNLFKPQQRFINNVGTLSIEALQNIVFQSPTVTSSPERNPAESHQINFSSQELENLTLNTFEQTEPIEIWTNQSKNGFLRLQLQDDFLHDEYPKVLSRQVLAQAMLATIYPKAVIGAYYQVPTGNSNNYTTKVAESSQLSNLSSDDQIDENKIRAIIPNQPFTPVIQSLHLNYKAQTELNLTDKDPSARNWQVFHLHPFNGFVWLNSPQADFFLPYFDQEGELLIGLENLQPLTTLNLLIQVAEETANTDLKTAEVHWSYLKDNTWKPFEDYQIISDSTNQLISSGIVQLAIPADISREKTTILDPTLHWLKVSVPIRSGAIPQIIGIHSQAAPATFTSENNDPNHLANPLPAGTITKLVTPQSAIKTIEQPYTSFGGRPPEQPQDYYIRISEHLRHKGRAITIFDYERIVLERFPEIYKVRCINHGQMSQTNDLLELVPGSVTLAVIPDLSQRSSSNILTPKVNVNLLEKIKKELLQFCSPWVDLHVVNPLYEPISVEFQVRFKDPYEANFDYYSRELNQAIVRFLSPWISPSSPDIYFGGKVYRSSILNFIEEQTYVDHVINFKMHQGNQKDLREVTASTARSILVSVPFEADETNQGHTIRPITAYPMNIPI